MVADRVLSDLVDDDELSVLLGPCFLGATGLVCVLPVMLVYVFFCVAEVPAATVFFLRPNCFKEVLRPNVLVFSFFFYVVVGLAV